MEKTNAFVVLHYRTQSPEELQRETTVESLAKIPKGTVLIITRYTTVKTQHTDKALVLSYEARVDGVDKRGRVYAPSRYLPELAKHQMPTLAIYKGMARMRNNTDCHDLFLMKDLPTEDDLRTGVDLL